MKQMLMASVDSGLSQNIALAGCSLANTMQNKFQNGNNDQQNFQLLNDDKIRHSNKTHQAKINSNMKTASRDDNLSLCIQEIKQSQTVISKKEESSNKNLVQKNSSKASQNQKQIEQKQFQVIVHEIQSVSSLSQNQQNRYLQNFTKSQLEIPLQYKEQTTTKNQDKLTLFDKPQTESLQDDFYVQYVEKKWNQKKKDSSQHSNSRISHDASLQPANHDEFMQKPQNNDAKKSQLLSEFLSQKKEQQVSAKNFKIQKEESRKNKQFKIKKQNNNHLNNSMQCKNQKVFHRTAGQKLFKESNSNFLIQQIKPNRSKKIKLVSNFNELTAKAKQKTSLKKQLLQGKVQYEIDLQHCVEKMSHLLEDKCYATIKEQNTCSMIEKGSVIKEQPARIRRIIKRSPYGILEIEVKSSENRTKITNLKILRPNQLNKLRKMPNTFKYSQHERSNSKLHEPACNKKQPFNQKVQNQLPLINPIKKML